MSNKANLKKPTKKGGLDPATTIANTAVLDKYTKAGDISNRVLAQVIEATVAGKTTYELSKLGDDLMTEELSKIYTSKKSKSKKVPKGIAFPTCVNPNHIPAHLAPPTEDDPSNITLADGDVVNVMLGVQIDGHPAVVAETVVVGASKDSPVTGNKADLLAAAWTASEAAIHSLRPGKRNWDITNVVDAVAKAYGTTPVESMLSHNQEQNVLYGPKEIILNPTPTNKKEMGTYMFEENEVYGLDILISTSETGSVKAHPEFKTALYKLTGNQYALKMKLSHKALADLKDKTKSQLFPINIRNLEGGVKARSGLIESCNHQVVLPYDIYTEKQGEFVAQFFTTVAVTPKGLVKLTEPKFNAELYKTDKKVTDEAILKTLDSPLVTEAPKEEAK
ncbi:hypothetical protein DICA0_E35806 [Diutina catenulata]